MSRKGNGFSRFAKLADWIGAHLKVESAVLDGELVCLDGQGRSVFKHLIHYHGEPVYFIAFDLLWLNGEDLRALPLLERKSRLRQTDPSFLRYLDHIEGRGVELFHAACQMDLEGIVAKWKDAP